MGNAVGNRVVVTGGAGFIGSHLCRRLLHDGAEVLCVDNFHTGSEDHLAGLLEHPGFRLLRHDITVPLDVPAHAIYNLACPASPVHYQADAARTIKVSVVGTMNMLDLARRRGARFLQASTSEVYGDPLAHPQKESDWGHVNPIGLRSCYDEGKRCAESLCMAYRRQHGVPVAIARIFNTYGPHMLPGDGRVVSNFIVQALRGDPLVVYGTGGQTRSFCYVSDTVDALVRLMERGAALPGPVNVGNPNECTVLELAQLVISMTGSRSKIVFAALPSDDPTRRCPDIALARQHLDWQPQVPLREGLARTIDYLDRCCGMQGVAAAGA
ncbi:MAG TPA: UDP-glucuronic acid decarboxylase family protein [Burkholderiaceae bacterium]|nr:UDP-glucuronic acid decarboxylase family protein [Burkholderiaceae bacterium]